MNYNLYSLEHTNLVKDAETIVKDVIGSDVVIQEVKTNIVNTVTFFVYGSKSLNNFTKLTKRCQEIANGSKVEITVKFDEFINIAFYNVNNGYNIEIQIKRNAENILSFKF